MKRWPSWLHSALGLVAWLTLACQGTSERPSLDVRPSASFGGSGGLGIIDAVPLPESAGSAGGGGRVGAGECDATPRGTVALLDDFDDGDSVAAYEAGREAYWFTVQDGSAGVLEPAGSFLPVADGYRGTKSAHVKASGFTTWGAELAANISSKLAVRCPYDASAFAGLRFVARGSGRVRVQLAMPGVIDKEYGGTCDPAAGQTCYDEHGSLVTLEEQYRVYELPWSSFTQRAFGTPVAFDPKTIHSLHFSMQTEELPIDLWVDDVAFWDGTPSTEGSGGGAPGSAAGSGGGGAASGGAAGSGGAGGLGGGAGQAAANEAGAEGAG
jgi:hypothetical protein